MQKILIFSTNNQITSDTSLANQSIYHYNAGGLIDNQGGYFLYNSCNT